MDSQAGTHLVPPAYALPSSETAFRECAPEIRGWLQEYETKYGRLEPSDVTTEKIPVSQTCGRARVIDVTSLVGTTNRNQWPASPEISPEIIKQYEMKSGALEAGDVVHFRSGHVDKHLKPMPEGAALMAEPLNGKSEGWPALSADAAVYLASKGIRCVGTDAPTLGGVDERQALMTYWTLASRNIVGVEFLSNLDKLPEGAYFLFAAIKIRDCHGGPGRAIALY
jgi:kynurenine formamidase